MDNNVRYVTPTGEIKNGSGVTHGHMSLNGSQLVGQPMLVGNEIYATTRQPDGSQRTDVYNQVGMRLRPLSNLP
jgi:hypothetical protein